MKPPIAPSRTRSIRRTARTHRAPRVSLRERILEKVWRRAMLRGGRGWLGDMLATEPLLRKVPVSAARLQNAGSEDPEGTMLLGTGNSLADQLGAIDSPFVKDILVRRAACAIAELHRVGGYLGYARAEHMKVTGNEVCFIELDDEVCDSLDIATAQTRDWMLFTMSIALHYEERVNDLAAILFRATRVLAPVSADKLRSTVNGLSAIEHPWCKLLGRPIRALRTAVLALRIRYVWQTMPASFVHALPTRPSHALLRYLDI